MPETRTVHLVDASPYIFRAFHSLPASIRSPGGEPTGAVYGFAAFLLKLIADEQPTHLGVAFDRNLTGSFRNRLYPAYKAHREAPPAELVAQLEACEETARALGAATFIDDDHEADDLIATLCDGLTRDGHAVVVVSSDKDLAQLVGPRVTLFDFARGVRYTPAEVAEKFGVPPERIADLLGLAGDPVDNIPGVPGIGRKTAAELLNAFDSLDQLLFRLEELPASRLRGARSLHAKLLAHGEDARLSRRLATVARDAPVHADLARLALQGAGGPAAEALFERLGFHGIRQRVTAGGRPGAAEPAEPADG